MQCSFHPSLHNHDRKWINFHLSLAMNFRSTWRMSFAFNGFIMNICWTGNEISVYNFPAVSNSCFAKIDLKLLHFKVDFQETNFFVKSIEWNFDQPSSFAKLSGYSKIKIINQWWRLKSLWDFNHALCWRLLFCGFMHFAQYLIFSLEIVSLHVKILNPTIHWKIFFTYDIRRWMKNAEMWFSLNYSEENF